MMVQGTLQQLGLRRRVWPMYAAGAAVAAVAATAACVAGGWPGLVAALAGDGAVWCTAWLRMRENQRRAGIMVPGLRGTG